MYSTVQSKQGFSFIELIVVIAIIGLLASVGYGYLSDSRQTARDEIRKNEIQQIALAFRLYADTYGADVDCISGMKIDGSTTVEITAGSNSCVDGSQILAFLESHFGEVPTDPLGPGNDDYYYYFDSQHICQTVAASTPLLFAVNLEAAESNAAEVCPDVGGNDGGYVQTTSFGGTINPSAPYVTTVGFLR